MQRLVTLGLVLAQGADAIVYQYQAPAAAAPAAAKPVVKAAPKKPEFPAPHPSVAFAATTTVAPKSSSFDVLRSSIGNIMGKFTHCNAGLTAALPRINSQHLQITHLSTDHVECRLLESQKKKAVKACFQHNQLLKLQANTICNEKKSLRKELKPSVVAWNKNTTKYSAYLANVVGTAAKAQKSYFGAKEACRRAKENVVQARIACTPLKAAVKAQHKECNSKQHVLEAVSCDINEAVSVACGDYKECYAFSLESYTAVKKSLPAIVKNAAAQKAEVLELACKVHASTPAALKACSTQDFVSEVVKDAPVLPAAVPSMTCPKDVPLPGSKAFAASYYGLLPKHVHPSSCFARCCVKGPVVKGAPAAAPKATAAPAKVVAAAPAAAVAFAPAAVVAKAQAVVVAAAPAAVKAAAPAAAR